MRHTQPHWEEVARIGLTSNHNDGKDNDLPGAFSVHCYRSPSSDLQQAPFGLELENLHTGEQCAVTINRESLLLVAYAALEAATRGVPVGLNPSEYFRHNGEVA